MPGVSAADTAADPCVAARWDELARAMTGCTRCPELAATRTKVVPGTRPAGARLLLVGEAPGREEDETGRPFVGRSGRLLDEVLAASGIDRARVAVTNTLKCRPPGNRPPRRAEVASCRDWLSQQIDVLDPALVVALGGSATTWFFGPGARLGAMRGRVHDWQGRRLLVTYHPSAAIRFGPRGAPLAALHEDLARAAALLREPQ